MILSLMLQVKRLIQKLLEVPSHR
uniref:Uncharacterized protein n=1 Tax=Arundo donax TaxID=35708 RepID=A0A0A8YDI5_ARUDO